MAKVYEINETKNGSLGGMVYYQNAGRTITRKKAEKINDARTKSQVEQRACMMATQKGMRNISTEFLQKCFEKKPRFLSYANIFTKKNTKESSIIRKDYAKDDNIIGMGCWTVSDGSLVTGLHLINDAKDNTTDYIGMHIADDTSLSADGNDTVGAVSTELLSTYPMLKEGMLINVVAVINVDVRFNNDVAEPLTLVSHDYYVKTIKQNFILNKKDSSKITTKGFVVKKGNDKAGYLLLLEEDLKTVCEDLKYVDNTNIGHASLVVSELNGRKVHVQSGICVLNKPMKSLIDLLDNDLENGMVNLKSYGFKDDAVIVNDEAI